MHRSLLTWIAAGAACASACALATHWPTPVDASLWFLALIVTALAWATDAAVLSAVPLLIAAEMAIPDERTRLLCFGAILCAAFAYGAACWSGGRL
ncbi:MAG TPA: hypothetical protein VFN10_21770, partial [Thermoanaerobaculia bacterium]|nr:hypothetical protein [Thermoanaerobaculia bacterium]